MMLEALLLGGIVGAIASRTGLTPWIIAAALWWWF